MAFVRITDRHVVRPACPSPRKSLFLSALDIMCTSIPHNRRILFYKAPADSGGMRHSEVVSRLKVALSETLAHFWPLAGRIRPSSSFNREVHGDDVGAGDGRVWLECNDAGAELLEARVEGISFAELEATEFAEMQPLFMDLVPWIEPPQFMTAPPLHVQISSFACGSFALGIAHSHVICDGTSLWHFLTSWAEIARGEELSMKPVHERTLQRIENPSAEKAFLMAENVQENKQHSTEEEKMELKVLRFSREAVNKIKEKAGGNRSSYEAVCAHVWRHVSIARGHSPDQKLSFIHVVNTRTKTQPPLSAAYFGNAAMWVSTEAMAGELMEEDLSTTANRLHATVKACDYRAWNGFLQWLEVHGPDEVFARCMLNGVRLRPSSSARFNVFGVDFGWGSPVAVRCPCMELPGKVTFFPSPAGFGSMELTLALPASVMRQLLRQPHFLHP
ncbi:hypothetical protein KP509_09G021000 [Ceratopteris richardii]|uniref:Uncharacterized protein n=1 Tax=Ceratopteris richardii TaxID=49495 RepID=A0A8T2U554_CERRI|nr:hypothetical protein KP509_09G021000 [Ceratopteris richardii]